MVRITDRPLLVFLAGMLTAFSAGVGAYKFLEGLVASTLPGTLTKMEEEGTLPKALKGDPGVGVAVGSIVAYAGDLNEAIPQGWLLCDGRQIDNNTVFASKDSHSSSKNDLHGDFSNLIQVLGNTWVDTGKSHELPDLRGLFLRGANNNRRGLLADPAEGFVGQSHIDTTKSMGAQIQPKLSGKFGVLFNEDKGDNHFMTDSGNTGVKITTKNDGLETRPKCAVVNYIIRYEPWRQPSMTDKK